MCYVSVFSERFQIDFALIAKNKYHSLGAEEIIIISARDQLLSAARVCLLYSTRTYRRQSMICLISLLYVIEGYFSPP